MAGYAHSRNLSIVSFNRRRLRRLCGGDELAEQFGAARDERDVDFAEKPVPFCRPDVLNS